MTTEVTVEEGTNGAWTVTVHQAAGRDQHFECSDERHARAFAQLFDVPDRLFARRQSVALRKVAEPELRVCRTWPWHVVGAPRWD